MKRARILIVDDEPSMRRILSVILEEAGYDVAEASGTARAIEKISGDRFDLVITDKKMPDGDGFEILTYCRETDPTLPVVMLTAFATVELAVEAVQAGAFDFLSKPFVPEVVIAVAGRATERARLLRENEALKEEAKRFAFAKEILGESSAIGRLKERIAKVAPTSATVLITGETGTGKELVARAIHRGSERAGATFLAVNCAAFSEQLLESELFGHEKGSFTGADRAKQGLFEAAHKGTLFLDETGEMSLGLQAKLLRVLTDGKILRVGSTTPRSVDVRIITATHRQLPDLVSDGRFREDLYYRLAVVPLELPPLRERKEDIPLLAKFFLEQAVRDLKTGKKNLSVSALDKMRGYDFPGNVRELRNLIERACILASGDEITAADLLLPETSGTVAGSRFDPGSMPESILLSEVLEELEARLLERALESSDGVQAEAARKLGISRSDIAYKLRKYKMTGQ